MKTGMDGSTKNFNRSQILRYNRAGAFIGFYDYTNMPDMFSPGFIAQSIYFDSHGNKWICLSSGGLIIKMQADGKRFPTGLFARRVII